MAAKHFIQILVSTEADETDADLTLELERRLRHYGLGLSRFEVEEVNHIGADDPTEIKGGYAPVPYQPGTCRICGAAYDSTYEEHTGSQFHRDAVAVAVGRR